MNTHAQNVIAYSYVFEGERARRMEISTQWRKKGGDDEGWYEKKSNLYITFVEING